MAETRSFGEWLRHRRRELDLTQEELAHQVGCAPITVRKIEADQMRPSKQMTELLMAQLRAARLFGAAESIFKEIGLDMSVWPQSLVDYNDWTAAARAQLGKESFAAAFAEGRAMTLDEAVKYALEKSKDD